MMNRYSNFLGQEWALQLLPFFESPDYKLISDLVRIDRKKGYIIAPTPENIFRAFLECPLSKLHTIIIGSNPYTHMLPNGKFVTDGLAFSSKESFVCPRPLENIYRAIDDSVYRGQGYHLSESCDLTRWANQGILLLNSSLTTVVGKPGHHFNVWKPFMEFTFGRINALKDSLAVCMFGKEAQQFAHLFTNPTYKILPKEFPDQARAWRHNDVFVELDEFHFKQNNLKINW